MLVYPSVSWKYPSSHTHGAVKNGYISNLVTFQIPSHFPLDAMMEKRVATMFFWWGSTRTITPRSKWLGKPYL